MATVIEAARALASVCDGAHDRDKQGFNGADAPFAHSVLSQRFVTPKQSAALHRLLAKYKGQLARLGFEYEKLEVPSGLASCNANAPERREHSTPSPAPRVEPAPAPAPKPKPAPAALEPWTFPAEEVLAHFPTGFKPRAQQTDAITQINDAFARGKRVVALEMPTGGGKSFICFSFADMLRAKGGTHFLTIQKTLQDQYTRDFPAPAIEVLKGRSNYPCTHPEATADMDAGNGVCHKSKKGILEECIDGAQARMHVLEDSIIRAAVSLSLPSGCHHCPYWRQLQTCHDSGVTLFNFSSFLFQTRIGRFAKRRLMIADEAHNIESQLMNFVSMELTEWTLSILNVRIDRDITSKDQFVEWLREKEVQTKIGEALKKAEQGSEDLPEDFSRAEAEALRELDMKLQNFMRYLDETEWVLETVEYKDRRGDKARKIVARPLYVKTFTQDLLFKHADRVLVMSATILDAQVWAENLGLDPAEVEHIQTPCDFPIENRPIHMEYAGNMGRKWFSPEQNPKDPTKPKFVRKIGQILERHKGQRGIIHCHSFELARILREEVASPRFLFQDEFENKTEMLAEHARRADSVIVAPAMHEGFDLKDDLSRFQVIAKVPWPSLGDKVVKERASRDDRWYAWLTALKLVQSYGRSIRSKDDWAMTYILDSGFDGFYARNGRMIPTWFAEALKKYAPKEVRR